MGSGTISIFAVPTLIWIAGIILALIYRWRHPKKYHLTLIAFICFLFSYAGLFLVKINPTENEKPSKRKKSLT